LLPLPLAARTAACLVVGRTFFPYLATDNGEREREKEREREAYHVLVVELFVSWIGLWKRK
jgi:hypothetical protein